MRLIDADKLKEAFNETDATKYGLYPNNVVDMQPTVDAVPVTRCGQCKWNRGFECRNLNIMFSDNQTANWFRADGEPREDGEADEAHH